MVHIIPPFFLGSTNHLKMISEWRDRREERHLFSHKEEEGIYGRKKVRRWLVFRPGRCDGQNAGRRCEESCRVERDIIVPSAEYSVTV
jgi:hypothetical protein